VDGVLLDLGVSSMQIDQANRGFSFKKNGPLDMRMSGSGLSAYDVVNNFSEKDLANIIYNFGEERLSRRIASSIVKERKNKEIDSTETLARLISDCFPKYKSFQNSSSHQNISSFKNFCK
jgi:16S rRNA (cytosine1402-N4)-methyltransferase